MQLSDTRRIGRHMPETHGFIVYKADGRHDGTNIVLIYVDQDVVDNRLIDGSNGSIIIEFSDR